MVDPFRSGSFGSIGFGPFNTGGGDFSRYNIADDGDNVALTKKYSAQIGWANGSITDEQYLGALAAYVRTTDKGSRDRISAQNEYEDAVYTIGRNRIVRAVNQASNATGRVAALRRLIGYDRKRLGGMVADNEQARELRDRIADSEAQVRSVRYSDLVRRYKENRVSIAAMLSFARNAAMGSRGGPDHETWLGAIQEWSDRADDEKLNQLYQDYEQKRIPGTAIIDFLKGRMGGMSPDSQAYADTKRTIEDLTKRFQEEDRAQKDAEMSSRLSRGDVSSAEYIRYLHKRVNDYPKGSSERRAAEDEFLNTSFSLGEDEMKRKLADGSIEGQDMADFYRGYMATMDPSSTRFLQLQQTALNYLLEGKQLFADSVNGTYAGGGRWVSLTGAPGGTPVNGEGFASQFDGSAFASNNCGMASAAMMAWAVSGGKIKVSGGDLRYYSGDRNQAGDERGTTFDDIGLAYQNVGLGLKQYHGMEFDAWKRRLLSGEGSLINGHYLDAPPNLRLTNNANFTHTMYVDRAVKRDGKVWFFVMDPLGRAGYNGQWWPEEAMKQYGWSGRANSGGGQWMGDVAFATKKGRSGTYINPDRDPPRYQAFDTDADGRSTIGKGGGTNRQEAGKRRDWSKGKQAEAPTSWPQYQLPADKKDGKATEGFAVTDEMVDEFLAAVDSASKPSISDPAQWGASARAGFQPESGREQDRKARAKALLGEWNGDARLAAQAWFTGSANPDPTTWDRTERFYANSIGGRLGYQPVKPGDTTALQPMPAPGNLDMTTMPRDRFAQADTLTPQGEGGKKAADIGTMLLEKLGIEPTPDMVRAVAAWIATEGTTIRGNNPGFLNTTGALDLPGQVGKDDQSGAVFGTLEEGIAAWATEIERSAPQIIHAARTNDPERFLVAIDRSGWVEGGYNGALIRTYNGIPGGTPIIGGSILKVPGGLRDLSRQVPSIAELFDVDPRDPVQMAWLDTNVKAAKAARDAGADSWTFTTPAGEEVGLEFSPTMASDLTYTKATYLKALSDGNRSDMEAANRAALAIEDHVKGVTRVAGDEWKMQVESLDRLRQASLARLDYATYINATFRMEDATKLFLGLDPGGPLDPEMSPNKEFLKDAGLLDDVLRFGDSLDIRDTSGDLSKLNPQGDPVLEMVTKGYLNPQRDQYGNIVAVANDPNKMFVEMTPEGKFVPHTIENDADSFEPAEVPVTGGGKPYSIPKYLQNLMAVSIPGVTDGAPGGVYMAPSSAVMGVVTLDSAGYKEAMAPEPSDPARQAGSPANTLIGYGVPSSTTDPRRAIYAGNINSGPNGMSSGGRMVTVAGRDDRMVATLGTTVDVGMLHYRNPATNKTESWYFVKGTNQFLGGTDDFGDKAPPRLVLGDGATLVNGTITINGEAYDPGKHDLSQYVHWYGTRPEDGAKGSMGADGTRWKFRQGTITPGGSVALDTSRVADPVQAYLEGDASYTELIWSGRTGPGTPRKVPEPGYGKPSKSEGFGMGGERSHSDRGGVAMDLVGVDFERAIRGETPEQALARNLAGYDLSRIPMTAGRMPDTTAQRAPLESFAVRLSAGVRAASNAANIAQQKVAIIAAQREAQARIAAIEAEKARRAAAAQAAQVAQVQATLPRQTQPELPQRPKPAPPGMGQNQPKAPPPKAPPPPVGPPKIPPKDPRTRPLDGGV